MLDRTVLKQAAKDRLQEKWGTAVIFAALYALIAYGTGLIPKVSFLFTLFVTPILSYGMAWGFLELIRKDTLSINDLFEGFKQYPRALGLYWWRGLWLLLWTLLLVVPGVIRGLAYSQAFFILSESPDVKVRDALKISIKMTEGYKWDLFVLGLSFLGWALLCILTLGIGFLWLGPYICAVYAAVYVELKERSLKSGVCTEEMFIGRTRTGN